MIKRLEEPTILARAARAVGKIDTHGRRGITLCSADEIEAMALVLGCLGVVPVPPGADLPDRLLAPLPEQEVIA